MNLLLILGLFFTFETDSNNFYQPKKPNLTNLEIRTNNVCGRIKTFPQFLNSYFTSSSLAMDVLHTQGYPNSKIKLNYKTEVWFYKTCEVEIENNQVKSVNNGFDCSKYILYPFAQSVSNNKNIANGGTIIVFGIMTRTTNNKY